jgi:hypothetical protein
VRDGGGPRDSESGREFKRKRDSEGKEGKGEDGEREIGKSSGVESTQNTEAGKGVSNQSR